MNAHQTRAKMEASVWMVMVRLRANVHRAGRVRHALNVWHSALAASAPMAARARQPFCPVMQHRFVFARLVGVDHFALRRLISAKASHAITAAHANPAPVGFDACAHRDFPDQTAVLMSMNARHSRVWAAPHASTASVASHAFVQRDEGVRGVRFVSVIQYQNHISHLLGL